MKRRILILVLLSVLAFGKALASELPNLVFFYSPSCHACEEVKKEFMPIIEKEFKGNIQIQYLDTTDIDNYKLLLSLKERYNEERKFSVPTCYFNGRFFIGKRDITTNLKSYIAASLDKMRKEGVLPEINLIERFKTFTPLIIISAGLIDGINPCAFTVIVFFISFLAMQGYRKRELIIISLAFIFTVFLTYLLIGLGLFGVLYRLKGFWYISKIFNFVIGIFSILMGILALYDFFKFKRTRETEGLLLQLPKAIKNRIHSVIGLHYREQTKDKALAKEAREINRGVLKLVISALITGFLVSLLEAVCTGQAYLPTITFVLKTSSLKLQAFAYLLLYNFMFIVPLLIIFLFALLGVTSEQFSKFLKRNLLLVKLIMAGLFFGLGILLLWRA